MSKPTTKEQPLQVAFIHPDLGIGGAEQLVVNLALSCQKLNWKVKLYTPSYDPSRAFKEIKNGTLPLEIHGNIFPRRIFGKFHALCEYIRVFLCALYVLFFGGHYDFIVLDQIPFPIPILNLRFKTFFYCHHPDKLLCTERSGLFKKVYRYIIDFIEELTMSFAHCIVVNSLYTQKVFMDSFNMMKKRYKAKPPKVIYPCIDLKAYDGNAGITKKDILTVNGLEKLKNIDITKMKVIVSLNRYERKKNLNLAVKAYLDYMTKESKDNYDKSCLIIAGGYDPSLQENIDVYNELTAYIDNDDKKKMNVFFLKNISNKERSILYRTANLVIYTPKNEHFGIVPIEAMYCGSWVIAHKSGGPMESVVDGKTGFLLDNEDEKKWGEKIKEIVEGKNKLCKINESDGMNDQSVKDELKKYVEGMFSLKKMEDDLYDSVCEMFPNRKIKKD